MREVGEGEKIGVYTFSFYALQGWASQVPAALLCDLG